MVLRGATLETRFGRYEAHVEIGDGAMGRVHRGFDPLVGRVVAIKTIKSEYLTKDSREEYLRRFRREAQAAGRLSHPNIVSIFDVGENYFVMEYVQGITLQALLRYRQVLDLRTALRLLAPVAHALDYAHRAGVVHRDIKPANIMVQPDGRPKLMDFGVARLEASAVTGSGQFFGSPSYMAPEQILGAEATHSVDLYSLAVVSYEVLTGQRPFQGDSITAIIYRVVNDDAPPPRTVNPDLPASFDGVFARALSKQPADRYPTAAAFITALGGEQLPADPADIVPEPIPEAARNAVPLGELETQAINVRRARLAARRWRWALPIAAVAGLTALALPLLRARSQETPPPTMASVPATVPAPPAVAALKVETEPAGARVWVDGMEHGQSPLLLPALVPGSHRVRVERAGHAPAEVMLELKGGEAEQSLRFAMPVLDAPLAVDSRPARATVKVDGRAVGTTPLRDLWLSPGPHEVSVERPGYRPSLHRLEARAGEPLRVEARLQRGSGAPTVTATAALRTDAPGLGPSEPLTVDVTETDPRPHRVVGQPAPYPPEAKELRLSGTVKVEMVVTETGEPTQVRVVESAGSILDEAVVRAVRSWRFEPGRKQGVKVRTRLQTLHTFMNPS